MIPEELHVHEDAATVDAALPSAVVSAKFDRDELTLEIAAEQIVPVARFLKTRRGYERLSSVTAVDWFPVEPRFEVVYHFHSVSRNSRLRLKSRVSGGDAEIDSLTGVYLAANWYEREVFDLFGIRFRHHPNLTRIMMPDDWEGYPLRKDYPKTGQRV